MREGFADDRNSFSPESGNNSNRMDQYPPNQGLDRQNGENQGSVTNPVNSKGANVGTSEKIDSTQSYPVNKSVTIIENKKRRTDDGPDQGNEVSNNTELDLGSEENIGSDMDQDTVSSKNGKMAGLVHEVRLEL